MLKPLATLTKGTSIGLWKAFVFVLSNWSALCWIRVPREDGTIEERLVFPDRDRIPLPPSPEDPLADAESREGRYIVADAVKVFRKDNKYLMECGYPQVSRVWPLGGTLIPLFVFWAIVASIIYYLYTKIDRDLLYFYGGLIIVALLFFRGLTILGGSSSDDSN